jgi:hypothetical protein
VVARALDERPRVARVRDVIEIEAAAGFGVRALLVIGCEQVAFERLRVHGDDVSALPVEVPRHGRDEVDFLRRPWIPDVDYIHAALRARRLVPGVQVGEVLVDRQVGDLAGHDRTELIRGFELTDQLDVGARTREMSTWLAVLHPG